ncbi:hypothetical protein [Effusibacillus pohliae]|uniref:hypothetical protein n=1 Tax=Effusibacillus pohliae TaxID=232270 RepID=UPI000376E287|nr:hypothetical protein [Effusibacillus pohliae]
MIPKLQVNQVPRWAWISLAGLLLASGIAGLVASAAPKLPFVQSGDLLGMIHELSGTTNQMLDNTKSLHQQVQKVEAKLGQLNQQEAILQKQTETGKNLIIELKTQQQLTAEGVSLMEQILQREQTSVTWTNKVDSQVRQLTQDVAQNAEILQKVAGSLQVSSRESRTLNDQMDRLLAELQRSQDAFRLFGKLKDLLRQPSTVINDVLRGLQQQQPPSVIEHLLRGGQTQQTPSVIDPLRSLL